MFIMAHIQRDDTDVVAADQIGVFFAIVQNEGKHPLQIVEEFRSFFLIQRQDDLTVGTGLKRVAIAVFSAQSLMVIDFTVHRQRMCFGFVVQWLGTCVDIHNRQTLMGEDSFFACIHAGPVGAAMAHQTGQFQRFFTQFARVGFNIQHTKN